jgi:hypothetical protein
MIINKKVFIFLKFSEGICFVKSKCNPIAHLPFYNISGKIYNIIRLLEEEMKSGNIVIVR